MRHRRSLQIYKIDGVGVDFERFHPAESREEKESLRNEMGYDSDDFILIYTAEFIPRKNHRLLFGALPALKEKIPELKVILCGAGALLERYKALAKNSRMAYVNFTGYTKEVADYCRISDVLVMPSLQEGLPIGMIEAMASGLPVAASDIRGHRDVIEDCANGFLFDADDKRGLARAIFALYKNPVLRAEMGRRNVQKSKDFSVGKILDSMKEIYAALFLWIEDYGMKCLEKWITLMCFNLIVGGENVRK